MLLFRILAFLTLALHVAWLLWLLMGWLFTRRRPALRWLHIGSLGWGVLISVFPWTCPLTRAEQYFERRAGLAPYEKSFLEHYVELLVYPEVNQTLLMWTAAGVCVAILCAHAWRFAQRDTRGW